LRSIHNQEPDSFLDDNDAHKNELHVARIELSKNTQTKMIGSPLKIDINNVYANGLLNQHIGRLITGDKKQMTVYYVEEITQQVVAGMLYKVKGSFIVENQKKNCIVDILEQKWVKNEKVIISAKCEDGSCYVSEQYTCSPESLYKNQLSKHRRFLFAN
jgi:hypothetical protein